MVRIFVYDGREYPDPDPTWSPDEVRQWMTNFFGELANAETQESDRDSKTNPGEKEKVFVFKKRVGVKG